MHAASRLLQQTEAKVYSSCRVPALRLLHNRASNETCRETCFACIKLLSSLYYTSEVSWLLSSPTPVLFHSLIYIQYDIRSLFMLIVLIFLTYLQSFNFHLLHNLLFSSFVFSFFLLPSFFSSLITLSFFSFSIQYFLPLPISCQLEKKMLLFIISFFCCSFVCLHRLEKQDC